MRLTMAERLARRRLNYVVGYNEFYPDRGEILRWDHLTEEMHRFRGGKWQNTPYR